MQGSVDYQLWARVREGNEVPLKFTGLANADDFAGLPGGL